MNVAGRIRELEAAITALRQEQHAELLAGIARVDRDITWPSFWAGRLWAQADVSADLRALFVEQRILSSRCLGKRLQQVQGRTYNGLRLERIGSDHHVGAIWILVIDGRVAFDTPTAP